MGCRMKKWWCKHIKKHSHRCVTVRRRGDIYFWKSHCESCGIILPGELTKVELKTYEDIESFHFAFKMDNYRHD